MFSNTSTPKLPSGQQMSQLQLPPVVQEQIHTIALQVLHRLFSPIVRRYRLRKIRQVLQRQYLAQNVSSGEVDAAVVSALQHVSFIRAVSRDLLTGPNNTAGQESAANTTAQSPTASHEGLPCAASASASASFPTVVDCVALNALREQVRKVVTTKLAHLVVYLQDEIVEWEWEPASEVLLLLAGAVERRGCAVAVSRAMSANPFNVGFAGSSPGTRRQSAVAAHASSRTGSLSYSRPAGGSRRGSASGQANASLSTSFAATTRSLPRRASGVDAPFTAPGGGRAYMSSPTVQGGGGGGGGNNNGGAMIDADAQALAAPQVFGELACLGAFPYCATLSVTSPMALLLRIPKEVYCKLVSECVPAEAQRRLLLEALQMRERLMPYYAPLTSARLLLCPLLTRLRPEHLEHIRDLTIPRVYAAGMECGEKEIPHHIFFIRRGVVYMQHEGVMVGGGAGGASSGRGSVAASEYSSQQAAGPLARASFSLELPKNRSVLVEGHTYGETGCIFGDALGDHYTAVTHVDMYLLPFQVLIQLMKQVPEVQNIVYRSAQELSFLRDREWPGVLFGPRQFGVELPNVHGVVPAQGLLANMAVTPTLNTNADWHSAGNRNNNNRWGSGSGLDPLRRPSNSVATRRVTIFEDASTGGGTADRTAAADRADDRAGGGLTGGRVSTALLTAMEQLPVVSLLRSFSANFSQACTQQWQCVTYTKGDVIASAGQECNRLLLFFEGRAGVVHNAALLREELRPGPFGVADINSVGPDAICPIPAGHVIGYTCVRRHRWTKSIVALDDVVEVWEIRRNNFVQLLRTHGMEREMQTASLQLLQPLAVQKDRLAVLDYQPLLHPMPNSLWRQQAVPNVHPVVVTKEGQAVFPVWREGDFPLDRRASVADVSTRSGSVAGRRNTLTAVGSVRVAAIANERQRSIGQRIGDSPKLASQHSTSAAALSDSDSGARTNFVARLGGAT